MTEKEIREMIADLTEEEKKDKYLFVSEQGTMEAKLEGRVETYLTFLEPEQPGD